MANPNPGGNVYKRDTPEDLHQAWNAVIRKINDERANPPEDTDCEALGPIEEVEEEHIWTVQDVEDVRTAIDDMCPFAWTKDLEYWKDEIITEIEDALDREYGGWGDEDECCEESCIPECSDYGEEANDFSVVPASGCEVRTMEECKVDYIKWSSVVRPAALAYTWQILSACSSYNIYFMLHCSAVQQVEYWQGRVDAQQVIVDAECAKPPPNNCVAEQAKLASYQSELTYWEGQRDYYESQRDAKSDLADSLANAQNAVISAASHPWQQNMWPLVAGTSHPWADRDCDINHGAEGPIRCRWSWGLGYHFPADDPDFWDTRWTGHYTPNGVPYAQTLSSTAPFASFACVLCCWSIINTCLTDPAGSCYKSIHEGWDCTTTWRLHAYSTVSAAEDCD